MPTIDWYTARDTGHVSTIEERLDQVFPTRSYYLRNPDGTNARSDQSIETFRKAWADKQKTTPEALKQKAAKRPTLTYKPTISIATIRRNAAEGLGIPVAAIVLKRPDGAAPKPGVHLSTFRGYWAKDRR